MSSKKRITVKGKKRARVSWTELEPKVKYWFRISHNGYARCRHSVAKWDQHYLEEIEAETGGECHYGTVIAVHRVAKKKARLRKKGKK